MAIRAEELRVKVTADTTPAEKGLKGFNSEVSKSPGIMKVAKVAAAGFAASAAVGFGGKLIMAASDLNETISKTGVVFGDQTSVITGYAQTMADQFGLPKQAVLDAASSFGLLGKAAGLSGKELSGMSTGLAGLAADASSFYNVPLDQALEDFRSGLSGEAEPLRKYGVMINDAAVQTEALAMGLVKPVKNTQALKAAQVNAAVAQKAYTDAVKKHGVGSLEAQKAQVALQKAQDGVAKAAKGAIPPLSEGQKVQARSSLITKGLSDASGDLARTQSSVSNRIRELKGRALNMAADFGTKLLPAVAAVLGGLLDFLGVLGKVAGFIGDHKVVFLTIASILTTVFIPAMVAAAVASTKSAIAQVRAWLATQAAAIKSSWQQVAAGVRVVAGWVLMGAQALLNAAKVVAGWVLMGTQSLIQAARMAAAWVIAMGPIALVIAAVVALAVIIYKNWDTIKAATIAVWNTIVGWVKTAVSTVVNWVKANWPLLLGILTGPIGLAVVMIVKHWNTIKAATSAAWNAVKKVVSGAVGAVKGAISSAWNTVATLTSAAWNRIKGAVSTAIGGLLTVVRGIPGKIKGALGGLGTLLTGSGKAIIQGLISGITGMAGKVYEAVKGVLKKARDLLPFSPAKEGPFSGKGWTLYSGRSIGAALAKGMLDQRRTVASGALGLAQAAVPPVGGLQVPGATIAGVSGAYGDVRAARGALTQTPATQGQAVQMHFNTYYPINEPQSQTTNRALQKVATLGLLG